MSPRSLIVVAGQYGAPTARVAGDNEYVARSDIIRTDGKPAVIEATYRRQRN